jgi:hypothetical protein
MIYFDKNKVYLGSTVRLCVLSDDERMTSLQRRYFFLGILNFLYMCAHVFMYDH